MRNSDGIVYLQRYIKSRNCGYEMELAYKCGKPVIPVVLNVPFREWPPRQIGETVLHDQFGTTAGDVKIFVDMSDPSNFFQKFNKELMPRLAVPDLAAVSDASMLGDSSSRSDMVRPTAANFADNIASPTQRDGGFCNETFL